MKGSVWIGCFLVCHQRHLGDWMFPWEELLESANSFDQWFIFLFICQQKKASISMVAEDEYIIYQTDYFSN